MRKVSMDSIWNISRKLLSLLIMSLRRSILMRMSRGKRKFRKRLRLNMSIRTILMMLRKIRRT